MLDSHFKHPVSAENKEGEQPKMDHYIIKHEKVEMSIKLPMEQTVLASIIIDAQNSVSGLEQKDPHLLTLAAERLSSHCLMLTTLVMQEGNLVVREALATLLQDLQRLRSHVNEQLQVCNLENALVEEQLLDISVQSVLELRQIGMPWSKIAKLHGISRNSMFKFRKKHHILEPNQTLSDMDLRTFIIGVVADHPNAGTGLIQGSLLSSGYRVPKHRVWQCLREVDPVGVALRRRKSIQRRTYRVKGANYLWHMDSTHKLINYGFVVHGMVDGYSRKIIYVNVTNNNTANTVLKMFQKGIQECGLPRRVRADRGVENVRVRDLMIQNSQAQNPFIYGRSVHNTRIERFWRDVNEQVVYVYRSFFISLEEDDYLDLDNLLDILCLAYVYMPRIQNALNNLAKQWNNHRMRTMKSRTPQQVWYISMRQQELHSVLFDETDEVRDADEYLPPIADNGLDIQAVWAECERILPDPRYEDFAHGTILYRALRQHLLALIN